MEGEADVASPSITYFMNAIFTNNYFGVHRFDG